ncbi:MAG: DUF2937 family protein [Deltaproteobacteria bacterium]|nr:DUF2937 family protein [Deltaproteobacteria bacterium]
MRVLYRYFLILVACTAVLLGIQIPNFVDQYEKRLDAHFIEVEQNLRGYQEIADRHYDGSIQALIKRHEESKDGATREEAEPIRRMHERYLGFRNEKRLLDTGLAGKIAFIAVRGNRELIRETHASYSFTIPLNREAVMSGTLSAAFVLIMIELLMMVLSRLFRSSRRRSPFRSGVRW